MLGAYFSQAPPVAGAIFPHCPFRPQPNGSGLCYLLPKLDATARLLLHGPFELPVAEKGQVPANLGHSLLILSCQPFELSLRARPYGTGGSGEICDGEEIGEMATYPELKLRVICFKGIPNLGIEEFRIEGFPNVTLSEEDLH